MGGLRGASWSGPGGPGAPHSLLAAPFAARIGWMVKNHVCRPLGSRRGSAFGVARKRGSAKLQVAPCPCGPASFRGPFRGATNVVFDHRGHRSLHAGVWPASARSAVLRLFRPMPPSPLGRERGHATLLLWGDGAMRGTLLLLRHAIVFRGAFVKMTNGEQGGRLRFLRPLSGMMGRMHHVSGKWVLASRKGACYTPSC